MKKICSLILMFCLSLTLISCNNSNNIIDEEIINENIQDNISEKIEADNTDEQITSNKIVGVITDYKISNTWNEENKICTQYDFTIYNNSNEDKNDWKVIYYLDNKDIEVSQIWNAKYKIDNDKIIFTPEEYNKNISKNNKTEFGLIIKSTQNNIFKNYEMYFNNEKYSSVLVTTTNDAKDDKIKDGKTNETKVEENNKEESKIETNMNEKYDTNNTPVSMHGKLSVSGTKIVDEKGNTFIIQGVSTHGLAWFGEYVNKEAFKTLRDELNVNTIRLAMYSDPNSGYSKSLHEKVKEGVKYASELGMYVIIDWHVLSEGNPQIYKENAKVFFKEMSDEYKNYNNVIYEICNEPNSGASWLEDIKPYAEEIIPVIRENDKDAIIIVGTPNWSQDVNIASNSPLTNVSNVVYALHFYAATHKNSIMSKYKTAIANGLPIIVSEFGISDASGNGTLDEENGNKWINLLRENGTGYVCWNLSNKNESSSLISSSCSKTSNWTDIDLSQEGKWLKNIYNN